MRKIGVISFLGQPKELQNGLKEGGFRSGWHSGFDGLNGNFELSLKLLHAVLKVNVPDEKRNALILHELAAKEFFPVDVNKGSHFEFGRLFDDFGHNLLVVVTSEKGTRQGKSNVFFFLQMWKHECSVFCPELEKILDRVAHFQVAKGIFYGFHLCDELDVIRFQLNQQEREREKRTVRSMIVGWSLLACCH